MGHVDDLMCVGPRRGSDIFLAKLKCVYEFTSTFLGPDAGEELEGKFLGRSICWRTNGLTWTGNVKMVKEALDEWEMCEAKEVGTPGMTYEYDVQSFLNADVMSKESAVEYPRTTAKLNYVALEKLLIAFASKEASRSMSSPRKREEVKLNRIMRFQRKRLTTTYLYEWQDDPGYLTGTPTLIGPVAGSPGDPPVEEFYMDRTCCFTTHELKRVSLCRVLRPN